MLKSLESILNKKITAPASIRAMLHGNQAQTGNKAVELGIIDTISTNLYSFAIGTGLDTAGAHLGPEGWLYSRGFAVVINSLTGGAYGAYRRGIFKLTHTTEKSAWLQQRVADLFVFNTAQTLIYGASLAVASYLSEGAIDWEKVKGGIIGLMKLSPLVAPTMGWFQDRMYEYCGFQAAAGQSEEGVYGR